MSILYLNLILFLIHSGSASITSCNETKNDAKKPYLCLKNDFFDLWDPETKPVKVMSTLGLNNVADIDDISKTITLDLSLIIEFNTSQFGIGNGKG